MVRHKLPLKSPLSDTIHSSMDTNEIQYVPQSHSKKTFVLVAWVIAVCLMGIGLVGLVKYVAKKTFTPPVVIVPTPTPDPLAPKNILLLGYGGAGHDGGLLTDTMIIAHLIPKEKRVILISIPRDLWVPIEAKKGEMKQFKINALYAIGSDNRGYPNKPDKYKGDNGGLLMAQDTVKIVTGLPIEFSVAIDFSGFTKLIKTLGGIFVDVPFSFEDKQYPITGKEKETCGKSEEDIKQTTATLSGTLLEEQFPCRYETLKFQKGKQFMDGETALKFVRSRHSDINGGDFGRSLRQQAFISGVKNRLLSFAGAAKLLPMVKDALGMVDTNISFQDVVKMVELYGSFSSYTIQAIPLTDQTVLTFSMSSDGQSILVPKAGADNWASISSFIASESARLEESTKSAVVQ